MMNMKEDSDEELQQKKSAYDCKVLLGAATMVMLQVELLAVETTAQEGFNKRTRPENFSTGGRSSIIRRRSFDYQGAHHCIMRDHLGPEADVLFGKEFPMFFRLSRPRVELIIQQFGSSGDPFYKSFRPNLFGVKGACLEAKILLPLKVLAYGVAPHTFIDYFQMSVSQAGRCCRHFNKTIPLLFGGEYNRAPDDADLRAITSLHKRVHEVDGMLGSLDCMHTYWKNCPVAWQQSFKGKENSPTIVLEAVADYNLWFWHQSYGYAGSLNDLNILNLSPLLVGMTDGRYQEVERQSLVVPFSIGNETFDRTFVLVDGIYPKYSRFVRGFKSPMYDEEVQFTAWQEGARKDIERAFGVLQSKWKAIAFPIQALDLSGISKLMATCLILHNMAVSDRVMGSVALRYVPSTECPPETANTEGEIDWEPRGAQQVRRLQRSGATAIGTFDERLASAITERSEWKMLKDPVEWAQLQRALIELKGVDT